MLSVLSTIGVCTLLALHVAARGLGAMFGVVLFVLWSLGKIPLWIWLTVVGGTIAVEVAVELIGLSEDIDTEKGFREWVWLNLPW